jgi:hypothetical protein
VRTRTRARWAKPPIFDTYAYAGPRNKGYDTWLREQEEKMSGVKSSNAPAPNEKKAKKKKAAEENRTKRTRAEHHLAVASFRP